MFRFIKGNTFSDNTYILETNWGMISICLTYFKFRYYHHKAENSFESWQFLGILIVKDLIPDSAVDATAN